MQPVVHPTGAPECDPFSVRRKLRQVIDTGTRHERPRLAAAHRHDVDIRSILVIEACAWLPIERDRAAVRRDRERPHRIRAIGQTTHVTRLDIDRIEPRVTRILPDHACVVFLLRTTLFIGGRIVRAIEYDLTAVGRPLEVANRRRFISQRRSLAELDGDRVDTGLRAAIGKKCDVFPVR